MAKVLAEMLPKFSEQRRGRNPEPKANAMNARRQHRQCDNANCGDCGGGGSPPSPPPSPVRGSTSSSPSPSSPVSGVRGVEMSVEAAERLLADLIRKDEIRARIDLNQNLLYATCVKKSHLFSHCFNEMHSRLSKIYFFFKFFNDIAISQ